MRLKFNEPRFDQLQATGDQPLLLDVPVTNHAEVDHIVVGANWRVFEPLVAMTVDAGEICIARRDGKPLNVMRVVDDDSFVKQTQRYPVFRSPVDRLALRKDKTDNTWVFDTNKNTPVADHVGALYFSQHLARVALEAQTRRAPKG